MGAASWVSDSFYCISYYLSWDFHCYSRASNFNLNWGQTVHCTTFNCRSVWLHFWTHQSLFLIWICVLGFEQKLKESLEVTVFFSRATNFTKMTVSSLHRKCLKIYYKVATMSSSNESKSPKLYFLSFPSALLRKFFIFLKTDFIFAANFQVLHVILKWNCLHVFSKKLIIYSFLWLILAQWMFYSFHTTFANV